MTQVNQQTEKELPLPDFPWIYASISGFRCTNCGYIYKRTMNDLMKLDKELAALEIHVQCKEKTIDNNSSTNSI